MKIPSQPHKTNGTLPLLFRKIFVIFNHSLQCLKLFGIRLILFSNNLNQLDGMWTQVKNIITLILPVISFFTGAKAADPRKSNYINLVEGISSDQKEPTE